MPDVRAQVILRTADNIPANFVTNSLAFTVSSGDPDTDELTAAIKEFYDDLSGIISVNIAQTGHMIKYYDLPGLTPNYPFEEDLFDLTSAPSGATLPSEVSIVLSFQGVRQAGFPQARRRGRIYIGPVTTSINTLGRPSSGAISQLSSAAQTFKSNVLAITGGAHRWAIWSVADQLPVIVNNGWVDNAFDTQRRRGVASNSRTTWN